MILSETVRKIRTEWPVNDAKRDEGLTTPDEIVRYDNLSYGPNGIYNLLDIYIKKSVSELQPAIINIHGGGWVYGNKEIYQHYCMRLALRGFAVVNINYRTAPENLFPSALEDINMVMHFVEKFGYKYHIDKKKLIMVGDSAGAQLVSHYAAIFSNSQFASLFDFSLPDVKIKALGLNCGAYNGLKMAESIDELFSEYLGTKSPDKELLQMVDVIGNITSDFPPSFVMSAVNDFLLPEAQPMYDYLGKIGVPAVLKIYGSKERDDISHIFHVNCKLKEAEICNDDECNFFKKYL